MWHLSPTVAVTPGGGGPVGEVGDAATVELEEWEMKVHVLGGVSLEQNRPPPMGLLKHKGIIKYVMSRRQSFKGAAAEKRKPLF